MSTITIPKKLASRGDLVVIPRKEYEIFRKWQWEIRDALGKVERGREEYRKGKTATASSPRKLR